jgi:hypothetical protein
MQSPASDLRRRAFARTWIGPALALVGAAAIGAILAGPATADSRLAWWIVHGALAPQHLLPLVGFGVAAALVSFGAFAAAFLLFSGGMAAAFVWPHHMLAFLSIPSNTARHEFLTGPIAAVAIGSALIVGRRLRPWILPPAAFVAGVTAALAIVVTDPSPNEWTVRCTGILIAAWSIGAVYLTLRATRRNWFMVMAPILGSWLIAIGLLYGGFALLPKREPPMAPAAPPSALPFPGGPADGIDTNPRSRDELPRSPNLPDPAPL